MPTMKGMPDSARQSAGGAASAGGNDFQARVAAWWLGVALLRVYGRGAPFGFPQDSLAVRVAAQTGDATDDVRVSFDSGHELYAQCKTGLSVSAEWSPAGGKKSKFAETWIQFYQQFASAVRDGFLALVLVVEEASGSIRNLQRILQRFRMSPAGTALDAGIVTVTKEERAVARKVLALFAAFAKDQNLVDFARHQDRLLRHVYVQVLRVGDGERDWLDLDALLQFGVLTDPGDSSHALRILADAGHALHRNRASLEYTGVSKRMLDAGIMLKDALDLGREWEALHRYSERAQDEVVDTLGRGFRLQRQGEIDSLRSTLQENRCVVVLGASGSGKSVVVKDWATTGAAEARRIVWLSGAGLDGIDPAHLRQNLGLRTEVDVIFQTETRPAFLVIDGVDRCFASEGFACLRHLLDACRLQDPESAWHLVLTCDELEWGRVVRTFEDRHIEAPTFVPLPVGPINTTAISQLLARFPELARLVGQRELWKLFENLKILDLVVNRLESGASLDASGWVSELQVADWWWQKEFADSAQSASRTVAVLELAKKQGDESRAAVALGDLSGQARGVADALHRDRCWKLVADSRVDFAHDLFGDWSRSRVLRSEAENSRNFRGFLLARASLPLWHRAIRLYAARLLESGDGLAGWQELFHSVTGGPTESVLVGDILLESIAFSSRLEVMIETLWPALSANGGKLLRRFLNRFLYAASTPHPGVLRRFCHRPDLLPLAKTYHRYPLWGHWPALLRFLAAHAQFVAEVAPLEVAKMSELCFRHTGKDTPGRAEMALLAVTAAEHFSYQKEHDHSPRREPRVARVYGAALHAFAEQPERVRELALQLSGRKQRQVKPEEKILVPPHQRWRRPSWWRRTLRAFKTRLRITLTAREESDALIESSSGVGIKPIGPAWDKRQKEEPWPDGPRFEVSEEFQRAFLTTDACETMIVEDPALAREILLATLIEEPRYPILQGDFGYSSADKSAGLTLKEFFDPPFYDQGPFLTFLEAQPEVGLDAVMRLINFASERWAKEVKKRIKSDVSSVSVWLEGQNQRWSGDWRLYYGYRGSSLISDSLACALMALERWLHERFEASEDLSQAFATLLERSRSVGVAGVLVSFGKRDPQLLLGPLAAIIGVPEFYLWEDQHNAQFSVELAPGTKDLDAAHRRRVEWAGLPFRRRRLPQICLHLFATNARARERVGELVEQWKLRLQRLSDQDRRRNFLSQLVSVFDPSRWTPGADEDGSERWTYSPPKPPADAQAVDLSGDEAAGRRPTLDVLQMIELPRKCLQCLKGQDETLASDPDALWNALEQITQAAERESGPIPPAIYVANTFALIALLLTKCREWLRTHPDAEKFCRGSVLAVAPSTEPPDVTQQLPSGDSDPQVFYAAGLAALWAESPGSEEVRFLIAHLAATGTDVGVAALCQHAFSHHTALGGGFPQLQSLVVYSAGERSRHTYAAGLRDRPGRFAEWLSREAAAFASGNNRRMPADWSQIRHRHFPLPQSNLTPYSRTTERQHPGLDFEYLVAAFSWIPPLEQAGSPEERRHWIEMRARLLETFLAMFPPRQGREDRYEGTPYPPERSLLSSTAQFVHQLLPAEEPGRFWKPLLGLGTSARYWVEEFVTDFLDSAAESAILPAHFVSLWGEMLDFASTSAAWTKGLGRSSQSGERLWRRLLAVNPRFAVLWQKHLPALRSLWPKIFGLLEARLRGGESLPELCHFFKQPFATAFLSDGLIFMERLCSTNPDDVFDSYELENSVAYFLLDVGQRQPSNKYLTDQAAQAYRALVTLLATRQNAIAMQLQREHGRASS